MLLRQGLLESLDVALVEPLLLLELVGNVFQFVLRAIQALLELGRFLRALFAVFLCIHELFAELGELALDDQHVTVATVDRLFERDNFFLFAVRCFAQRDELAREWGAHCVAARLLELLLESRDEVFDLGEPFGRYVSRVRR